MSNFDEKVKVLRAHHEALLTKKNEMEEWGNGIYDRWKNPILTAEHTPLEWRYDFNEKDNPYLMQRNMMNTSNETFLVTRERSNMQSCTN